METRAADIEGNRLPTWTEVLARDYRPWTTSRLVIDTGKLTVEESVRTIQSALAGASAGAGVQEKTK